jgi:hypothetical protein
MPDCTIYKQEMRSPWMPTPKVKKITWMITFLKRIRSGIAGIASQAAITIQFVNA